MHAVGQHGPGMGNRITHNCTLEIAALAFRACCTLLAFRIVFEPQLAAPFNLPQFPLFVFAMRSYRKAVALVHGDREHILRGRLVAIKLLSSDRRAQFSGIRVLGRA